MIKPIIIINFKTYPSVLGEKGVELAKLCDKISHETRTDIRIAVPATDIYRIVNECTIPVYAEHVDPFEPGKHTGTIILEMIHSAGAHGSLVNHSEHQIPVHEIEDAVRKLKEHKMVSVVCANSPEKASELASINPNFIAVEPPELIGGKISVSKAKPEIISESVKRVKQEHDVKLLVGAGIHTKADVDKAMELGADGVLIASGITEAKDPEKAIRELIV